MTRKPLPKLAKELFQDFGGSKYTIKHCEGAYESFCDSVKHCTRPKPTKQAAKMRSRREKYANGERLPNKVITRQAEIKDGLYFYRIRLDNIRCYFWHSKNFPNTIYVSHYIWKDFTSLSASDVVKVKVNFEQVENQTKD